MQRIDVNSSGYIKKKNSIEETFGESGISVVSLLDQSLL